MNISQALNNLHFNKKAYFYYKFPDARYDQSIPARTEEEFLKIVGKKTIFPFLRWEKTPEYKALVALYLESKAANDLERIYSSVREKALTGEEKSVKLFLTISKEISTIAKQAQAIFTNKNDQPQEDDELIV